MMNLDECVSEILSIEKKDGPCAIGLAKRKADEFLAAYGGGAASFARGEYRKQLRDELLQKGPKTPLMDQIIDHLS
jgi:hypothetical protein